MIEGTFDFAARHYDRGHSARAKRIKHGVAVCVLGFLLYCVWISQKDADSRLNSCIALNDLLNLHC
jgi:hypothetical protein